MAGALTLNQKNCTSHNLILQTVSDQVDFSTDVLATTQCVGQ
jgi:hypothetical protein